MNKLFYQLLPTHLVSFFLLVAPADAGRPLVVDDAEPVALNHLELEIGFAYSRPVGGGRDQKLPALTLTYGIIHNLELGLAITRVNQDFPKEPPLRGFEDLHIAAKYRLIAAQSTLPAIALAIDVKAPTANQQKGLSSGKTDTALLLIASKSWHDLRFHTNLGYSVIGKVRGAELKNIIHGGLAAEKALNPQWSVVGEVYGASRPSRQSTNEANFHLGLRYSVNPALVLDGAIGRSLLATGNRIAATAGITWTFDLNPWVGR